MRIAPSARPEKRLLDSSDADDTTKDAMLKDITFTNIKKLIAIAFFNSVEILKRHDGATSLRTRRRQAIVIRIAEERERKVSLVLEISFRAIFYIRRGPRSTDDCREFFPDTSERINRVYLSKEM